MPRTPGLEQIWKGRLSPRSVFAPRLLRWIWLVLLSLLVAYRSLILMDGASFLGTSYRSVSGTFSPWGLWLLRGGPLTEEERLVSRDISTCYLATLQTTFFKVSSNSRCSCTCEYPKPPSSWEVSPGQR